MTRNFGLVGAGALAIVSTASAVVYWFSVAPSPEFRDRAFPEGFRELVVGRSISRLDSIAGPQPAPNATPSAQGTRRSTREVCDALFRDPATPAVGNPHSSIQIAAFLDYRCPYCRTLTDILSAMQGDNLRVAYKEWPVLGAASALAARAALAADRQGQYFAFHRRLMSSRFVPTMALIDEIAGELGISRSRLREDMDASEIAAAIDSNRVLASELALSGTPALVVGRTVVEGAIARAQLERLIRDVAAGGPSSSC